ncbi:MAG: HlyD family efflux transporter periplasmic adaptor subunit [Chromatiales bacterium]|nr:HlyD family efflux transporter periplasmic adaptor subunit [Chromatiales bacterium]
MPQHLTCLLSLSGLVLLLLAGCNAEEGHDAVGLLEWERVELTAEASETITAVAVAKGETVVAGQTILELDRQRLDARRAQTAQQKAEADARLAELRRGPRAEEIEEARARVRGDESDLANAQRELNRAEGMVERKLASQESLDNARAQRDRARSDLEVSKAALKMLLAGSTIEQLHQAEAQLAQAQAKLSEADLDLDRLTLRAPRPGRVDDLPYHVGERPPLGATLAVLLADSPYARVYVPEPLRARVTPGMSARVYVDGFAQPFQGHVRRISSEATFTPYFSLTERDRARLSYVAEIDLDGAVAAKLPAGVPVRVDFVFVPSGEAPNGA